MDYVVYSLATLSFILNVTLVWYIRKLMAINEDNNIELAESISVFQDELEKLLDMDVLTGEPILVKLLDDVRQLGQDTEEIRTRLIPNKDGELDVE